MNHEEIILKVVDLLNVSRQQAIYLIRMSFNSEDPFSELSDLLGFENTELIFDIFKFKDFLIDNDFTNTKKLCIEHIIPEMPSINHGIENVAVSVLGDDAKYFKYSTLNTVQSSVFNDVYNKNGNILISAPTGAGKTEVAILAILRALKYKNGVIIYIVPMKALASEIYNKLSKLFKELNVVEFTGDTDLDSIAISKARIIICTPEKFDVATRRHYCAIKNIRLVIIDEIHLLEEDRGPVLESIVARVLKSCELNQFSTRILGLSATLPNYNDVAEFIKAEHIHFFNSSYRPVPLRMKITGFIKDAKYTDELNYLLENTQSFLNLNKQILIFVHSRVSTWKIANFLSKNIDFKEILDDQLLNISSNLQELARKGVCIHHAGLSRNDRNHVENLFKMGKLRILVCTSTLAWGVNLPVYAVIIFGSSYYDKNKGGFNQIGILDVLQIFGRAGRPQFDSKGEGILITKITHLESYIKQLKRNMNIESKMLFHVPENINAEIYLGNVLNISDALRWLKNTFLYTRMIKNPVHYGILPEEIGLEEQALSEYIYLTIKRLEEYKLIDIVRKNENPCSWTLNSSFFGYITSLFYLNHVTVADWINKIDKINSNMEIMELLFESQEFLNLSVRTDEIGHLQTLHNDLLTSSLINIDFDETLSMKLIILFICYINYRSMPSFSLQCDIDFMVDNLSRIISAFKEFLLYLKRFELFHSVFLLEKSILKYKMSKTDDFKVNLTRIDDYYVVLNIVTLNTKKHTVFVINNKGFSYIREISKGCKIIFKYPNQSATIKIISNSEFRCFEVLVSETFDYSVKFFLDTGVHFCDKYFKLYGPRIDCIHLKNTCFDLKQNIDESSANETYNNCFNMDFNIDITYFDVENSNINERAKIINGLILNLNLDSVLIVCLSMRDATETLKFLNIKSAVNKLEDLSDGNRKYSLNGDSNCRRNIVCFDKFEIRKYKNIKNVIMKGVVNQDGLLSIYKISKTINNKKAFIYDCHSNTEYLKHIFSSKLN